MIMHMYTGPDGKSYLKKLAVVPNGQAGPGEKSTQLKADTVSFIHTKAGTFLGQHNAPRRQLLFYLAGKTEIGGLGDGTHMVFVAGDIVMADDLTGEGHTTTILPGDDRLAAVVPLQ